MNKIHTTYAHIPSSFLLRRKSKIFFFKGVPVWSGSSPSLSIMSAMALGWIQEIQRHCLHVIDALEQLRFGGNKLPNWQRFPSPGQQRPQEYDALFGPSSYSLGHNHPKDARHAQPGGNTVVSREDVGRATWLFLHTLAAQYPERPTAQQKRDARELMHVLSRLYPCAECARHFKQIIRAEPPLVGNRLEFSQWMCRAHNVVNRSLNKPTFNCNLVDARWAGLECGHGEGDEGGCSLEVGGRGGRL